MPSDKKISPTTIRIEMILFLLSVKNSNDLKSDFCFMTKNLRFRNTNNYRVLEISLPAKH